MAESAAAFKVQVDDKVFVLDRITLGDWRMFKTEFGLTASDIVTTITDDKGESVEILNIEDPNVLVGLIVAALHHERPYASVPDLIAEVEGLDMSGISFPQAQAEGEDEPDPTKLADADSEGTVVPAKSGGSAKPRKKPGTRR